MIPVPWEDRHPQFADLLDSLALRPQNGRWPVVTVSKFPVRHQQVHTLAGVAVPTQVLPHPQRGPHFHQLCGHLQK